jgi:hypothetical protein
MLFPESLFEKFHRMVNTAHEVQANIDLGLIKNASDFGNISREEYGQRRHDLAENLVDLTPEELQEHVGEMLSNIPERRHNRARGLIQEIIREHQQEEHR